MFVRSVPTMIMCKARSTFFGNRMEKINQRRFHRVRPTTTNAKSGTIFVDLKKPATPCNVVDISAGGACIEVHGTATIPKRFVLNHCGVKKSCRLVWQKGRRIGVCF